MGLLQDWREYAYGVDINSKAGQAIWTKYFNEEKAVYAQLLADPEEVVSGTVKELAEKYKCAIILIGHMNKCSVGKSAYRGLGSIDFQAAARSVLIVGRIKDEPEIRVVCQTKSSLAPEAKAVAFRLSEKNGFEWVGEYDVSADDLLSGTVKGTKKQAAMDFLENLLASGQVSQTEIMELAKQKSISEKTLRNAKDELRIKSKRVNNQWYWSLD